MSERLLYILEQVSVLFKKKGIKCISMDVVARELGISKKTLYKHVTDKADLIAKLLTVETKRIEEGFARIKKKKENAIMELVRMNLHVKEMIKDINPLTYFELRLHYPELFRHFMQIRRAKMYEWIRDNMIKGKKEGLFRKDLNEDVVAKIYVSRIEGFGEENTDVKKEVVSNKFYTEMLIYHIHGISNEKGIRMFKKNRNQLI